MQAYMPYFISPEREANITWVGRVPQHTTFELKKVSDTKRDNYIMLPLDTELKKAVDICDSLNLSNESTVSAWDVEKQEYLNDNAPSSCGTIRKPAWKNSTYNFNLQPGAVYRISGLTEAKPWTQE